MTLRYDGLLNNMNLFLKREGEERGKRVEADQSMTKF